CCLCHGKHLTEDRLILHCEVPALVRRRGSKKSDVDMKGLIEQPRTTLKLNSLYEIFSTRWALSAALIFGIDKGVQTNMREETRSASGNLANQLRQCALRKGIGFDPVFLRKTRDLGSVHEGATYYAAQQSVIGKVTNSSLSPVTQTNRVYRCYVARRTRPGKPLTHRLQQGVRYSVAAARTANQKSLGVLQQVGSFLGGYFYNHDFFCA